MARYNGFSMAGSRLFPTWSAYAASCRAVMRGVRRLKGKGEGEERVRRLGEGEGRERGVLRLWVSPGDGWDFAGDEGERGDRSVAVLGRDERRKMMLGLGFWVE
ncbi:hypothetical protein HAX54_048894 [Datura stramonium]|uniref:Uncharacterized protein n=1 Tax=Datura stramonium TaxID=4076 RepID=A0ABS8SUC5_DATST|nr:hypothetical protein [Datura stramonium]